MINALRETAAGAFAGTIYKRRSTRCLPLVMSAAGNICVLECVLVKEQKEDEEQEEQEEQDEQEESRKRRRRRTSSNNEGAKPAPPRPGGAGQPPQAAKRK